LIPRLHRLWTQLGESLQGAEIIEQATFLKHFQNLLPTNSSVVVPDPQYHCDNNELVEVSVPRYKEPWSGMRRLGELPFLIPRSKRRFRRREPDQHKETAMYRFTSTVIISALALTQVACAGPALDRPQVVVHFADLDLSRSQGAAVLYQRLRAASETVCAPLDGRDLERHVRFKECVQSALSTAVAEVDRPALTEHYMARTSGHHLTIETAQTSPR
jgi:UrcA family protein